MGLERLSPGPAGIEPAPSTSSSSPASPPSRARKPNKQVGQRPRKAWPTREEREARAEAKQVARAQEIAQDPVGFARQVCLDQLAVGPRTRHELMTVLAKKGVPDLATEEVLSRFTEVGMIDDTLFASMWVSSRHRGRGLAGFALSQELRRKGVDDETVREAVAELDPDQELATARALVQRKLSSTRGLATDARVRRLAGMLARKGYGAGVAFRVVREELAQEGSDPPELSFDALQALED